MTEYYYKAEDVMKILGVKQSKAYNIIKKLNDELKEKGFLTVAGRVPKKYFLKRCGVSE